MKYKLSRKEIEKNSNQGKYGFRPNRSMLADLLATVPEKKVDNPNCPYRNPDCPICKPTPPQLPEIEKIDDGDIRSLDADRLVDKLWEKHCQIIDRLNILSKRV